MDRLDPADTVPAKKRRTRYDNIRLGYPPVITERDEQLFQALTRYRYLDSRQLRALLCVTNENGFAKRLRKLTDWGYIHRVLGARLPRNQLYLGHEIYELWDEGVLHLAQMGIEEDNITGLSVGANVQFPHALMIIATLVSFEVGARSADVRFITWQEILARAPKETRLAKTPWLFPEVPIAYQYPSGRKEGKAKLRPDSPPFGFGYPQEDGGELCIFGALEAERTNKIWANNLNDTSWLKKALGYRELRRARLLFTHFNLPNFYIFTIAPTRTHCKNMAELVMDITGGSGSEMFCFSPIPVFGHVYKTIPPKPELFTTPWPRAGRPDLDLTKP